MSGGARDPVSDVRAPPGAQRFEFIRTLGTGGYGTVYEVRERATGARVALKELHEQTGESLLSLKGEFRVLAELAHPNVVRFLAMFEEQGRFYFTMEFIEGQNLLDYVRPLASSPVSPETGHDSGIRSTTREWLPRRADRVLNIVRLRQAFSQLANGLIVLHSAGLVHRDLKPQNVHVTTEGRVVLLDFGLTTRFDDKSRDRAGTFAYMAPEQALGRDVRPSADWYAFGAVLYEALTGRTPHAHLPVRNLLAEARTVPPDPRSYLDDLPSDLCGLCMALLSYDPLARPNEASIADALGLDVSHARASASFRSQIHFTRDAFVAREAERHVLAMALADAKRGRRPIVHIQGESGIGKSTLIERFNREIASESDLLVLASRCYEREAVPFRGIDGLVDDLARRLASNADLAEAACPPPAHAEFLTAVFPVMQAVPGFETFERPALIDLDPLETRRHAFEALSQLLQRLTVRWTVVLQLDDTQWLDPESVAMLSYLTSGPLGRTMLVFSTRPAAFDPLAEVLGDASEVVRLVLKPFSPEESERLVALLRAAGPPRDLDVKAVAETSGGHPLFIYELVVHSPREVGTAVTLEAAIANRVAALDEGARSLLNVVALAVSPLRHAEALEASELASEKYAWVLSTLRNENLVSFRALSDEAHVEAYHDRIRDVVVRSLSPDARRRTHEQIARALERQCPDEHEALAVHFAGAGCARQAIDYARSAAERSLQTLGFENAATLLSLALRFEEVPAQRAALESSLAQALANSGRGKDAAAAYLRAAAHADEYTAIELRRRAGEQLLRAGHIGQGTDLLFHMLRQLGLAVRRSDFAILLSLVWALIRLWLRGLTLKERNGPLATHERLRLDLCWTVATGLSVVHHLRATEFQARALLLGLDSGDRDRVIKAAALLGVTLGMIGGATKTLAASFRARARELAGEQPSDDNAAWLQLTDGVASMGDWNFIECETLCARAEATLSSRCPGASWEIVTAQAFGLWSAAFRGDLRSAAQRLPELMASARSRGDRHAETSLILSPLHLVGLGSDDPATVRSECTRILCEWPSKLACFQHMCGAYVLAQTDLYEGRINQAWVNVTYAWRMLRRGHLSQVQFQRVDLLGLRGRTALGRASAEHGRRRRAWLRYAERDAKHLTAEGIPSALGLAALVKGGAALLRGDTVFAGQWFECAAIEFDQAGMLLHSWVVRFARALTENDDQRCNAARRRLAEIGVSNPMSMLGVWLPGFTTVVARGLEDKQAS